MHQRSPMMDLGSGLNTIATASGFGSAINTFQNAAGTVGKLAGALNNLSNPAMLISKLRSINLPSGGETSNSAPGTKAIFGEASTDWRVRLSIPAAYAGGTILSPLVNAGGLIFPYTPTVAISHSATYSDIPVTHSNYQFVAYENSRIDTISVSGPFNVEDGAQALYWIAAVHFLRSVTKMFTGAGDLQGNPPPILKFNGYGDFVFKNVPVVVKSFSIDLPSDVNYITTSTASGNFGFAAGGAGASSLGSLSSTVGMLGGLAGAVGSNKLAGTLGKVGAIGGAIAGAQKLLGGGGASGGGGLSAVAGNTHVPTKSTLTVTLQPVYSREAVRNFSLQNFVKGDYVKTGGYI